MKKYVINLLVIALFYLRDFQVLSCLWSLFQYNNKKICKKSIMYRDLTMLHK